MIQDLADENNTVDLKNRAELEMMMSEMEHGEVRFVKKCRRLRTRRERVDPTPHKEIQNRSRSSVEKNMD